MKKVILVDDKTTNMRLLQDLIARHCPTLKIVATASGPDEAYDYIESLAPDIVFLDIEMPGGNGFDLLSRFRPVFFEVIFTTAYSHYAPRAFREQALDYLLKPICVEDLSQAVRRAEKQIELKQSGNRLLQYLEQEQTRRLNRFRLPAQDGFILINPDDILRCEASGSYTMFHFLNQQKTLACLQLKNCIALLPSSFFRVHHSHIVNLNYVRKYVKGRGGQVVLIDGTEIDVAANRKGDFIRAISKPVER